MADSAAPDAAPDVASTAQAEFRLGLTAGISAYLLWGFLPLYYTLTDGVPAYMVVAHRIIWSVLSVGLFLVIVRRMGEVKAILKSRKPLTLLFLSAALISVNWLVFIWAIEVGRVLEVSFGYFINPLVNIVIGLVLLGEKLTRAQTIAAGLTVVAIASQGILLGSLPWVSLVLAFSFAAYGYVRKMTPVGATPGLFIETLLMTPFSLGFMIWLASHGGTVLPTGDPGLLVALLGTGIVTALPLILFATSARRLPLSLVGFLQYIAPSIQFLLAISYWGEPLSTVKLASFVLIWISLAIVSVDAIRRRERRPARA
ncbi:EamA family transporter RarD [Stappia sp. F7233]|uniref:EamA family transporter RarD n=1 Tax=Stappia albiluteola TaxID=2758565 RepID=A0A839AI28_9HYPH|nr:EamA family transporter RarD [Stappia albiluteola]MBA5779381.1 EamA family transporter RarD [Stappia albiluteola]